MPLCDRTLELVFSFLLEECGETELQLVARPACRFLQARLMRGFDHVALRVCRLGLQWAMRQKAFSESVCNYYRLELRRLQRRDEPASFEVLEPSPWLPRLRRRDELTFVLNV